MRPKISDNLLGSGASKTVTFNAQISFFLFFFVLGRYRVATPSTKKRKNEILERPHVHMYSEMYIVCWNRLEITFPSN